jgi:chromosome segregation ATPase
MFNETENPSSEYEITINKLSEQIEELFSKIHYYQAIVAEKEIQIKQLLKENQNLIAKVQKLMHQSTPPPEPSQESYTPPTYPSSEQFSTPPAPPPIPLKKPESSFSVSEDPRINKRQCPNCGAVGFAIREIDDKSKVISYSPRRMYAKKKACTKCRYEWS